jgi:hypothetical protein
LVSILLRREEFMTDRHGSAPPRGMSRPGNILFVKPSLKAS